MDSALDFFRGGLNCAQSVLASAAVNVDPGTIKRIASAFGAGMGREQRVCGAVTGALMALGLRDGFESGDDRAGRERVYDQARWFQEHFAAQHGSCDCRELLGVDLRTDEGQKEFREKNLRVEVCEACIATAVNLLERGVQ